MLSLFDYTYVSTFGLVTWHHGHYYDTTYMYHLFQIEALK